MFEISAYWVHFEKKITYLRLSPSVEGPWGNGTKCKRLPKILRMPVIGPEKKSMLTDAIAEIKMLWMPILMYDKWKFEAVLQAPDFIVYLFIYLFAWIGYVQVLLQSTHFAGVSRHTFYYTSIFRHIKNCQSNEYGIRNSGPGRVPLASGMGLVTGHMGCGTCELWHEFCIRNSWYVAYRESITRLATLA